MFRRYVLPCVLIMAISVATAWGAYAASESIRYSALCTFEAVIRLSPRPPQNTDEAKLVNSLAGQQVGAAIANGIYAEVAKNKKVRTATIARNVSLSPSAIGLGTFGVRISNTDPKKAMELSSALCDAFVAKIVKQRAESIHAQQQLIRARIATIQKELTRLERIPRQRRTTTDNASIVSQRRALLGNTNLIADINTLPPDSVSVLGRANPVRRDTRDLSRNLLIALVAGLLACFLYVLIGEMFADRRRMRSGQVP